MTFAELIETKMKEKGIKTWYELSVKAGLDHGNMSRFRNGIRGKGITLRTIKKLCVVLDNITMQEILECEI